MNSKAVIFQVCVVVRDVRQISANWAKILGRPEAEIQSIVSGRILHFTHGAPAEYTDCQVAKYELDAFVLELIQPGPNASRWRDYLERNGQGVLHVCLKVDDRRSFQKTLSDTGVGLAYHVGYYPSGSYSYVDSSKQLGLELSVNHHSDYMRVLQRLLGGMALPLDEMK